MSDCKHKFIDEWLENGCSIALCEHCKMTEDEVALKAAVEKLEAFIERDAEYIRKIRSKKIKLKNQVEELESIVRPCLGSAGMLTLPELTKLQEYFITKAEGGAE